MGRGNLNDGNDASVSIPTSAAARIASRFSTGASGQSAARRNVGSAMDMSNGAAFRTVNVRSTRAKMSAAAAVAASVNGVSPASFGAGAGASVSRSELVRVACSVNGFSGDNDDVPSANEIKAYEQEMAERFQRSVHVQSSGAGYEPHASRSLGAPASTSLMADPSNMSVASPAGGDSPWSLFFGEGQFPYKSRYDVKNQDTWTLPQALAGETPRISDTIELLTFINGNWYTDRVAPIVRTNALSIQWSKWIFSPHLTDVVPEMGVNRLVQSRREHNSARFTRRAIGFMLEHGFMRTEMGIMHYMMNVSQIVSAVVETNKFDVIHTLLTCHDQNKAWLIENNQFNGQNAADLYMAEIFRWDIFKKKKNALHILDTEITAQMDQYRGEADTWIMHQKSIEHLTQVAPERIDTFIAGEAGPRRLMDGPEAFTTFRGNSIFVTRSFHVDEGGAVDIMAFPAQIGEHHFMSDLFCKSSVTDYKSVSRDIEIYDEDKDRFACITLGDALDLCGRFDEAGELADWDEAEVSEFYSQGELEQDMFHYRDSAGELRLTPYFVNIKDQHMSARSRILLGETVKAQLKGLPGYERADTLLAFARSVIAKMESYSVAATNAFLVDGLAANAAQVGAAAPAADRAAGNNPLLPLSDFIIAADGRSGLPAGIDKTGSAMSGITWPPGYQSYDGFRAIVKAYDDDNTIVDAGKTLQGVTAAQVEDLRAFVDYLSSVATQLEQIFPNSLALDAGSAASWWVNASAETVIFSNFVHKYRVPLWFQASAGSAGPGAAGLGAHASAELEEIVATIAAAAEPYFKDAAGAAFDANTDAFYNMVQPDAGAGAGDKTDGTLKTASMTAEDYAEDKNSIFSWYTLLYIAAQTSGSGDAVRAYKLNKVFSKIAPVVGQNLELSTGEVDIAALTSAIKALSKTKANRELEGADGGSFFKDGFTAETAVEELGDIYARLQEIGGHLGDNADLDTRILASQSGTDIARTTLLASPNMVAAIAQAANRGADLISVAPFIPSDASFPDVPMSVSKLRGYTGISSAHESARPAAFIARTLKHRQGGAADIEHFEFVQSAIGQENQHKLQAEAQGANEDDDDMYDFDDNESLVGGMSARIGASIGDFAGRAGTSRAAAAAGRTGSIGGAKLDGLRSKAARENFDALAKSARNGWSYIFAGVFNLTPVHKDAFEAFIANDVLFPANFIISRPHAEYECCYAIKLKRGTDTIATYQKRGEFETGDDVAVGVHTGHYRYYS